MLKHLLLILSLAVLLNSFSQNFNPGNPEQYSSAQPTAFFEENKGQMKDQFWNPRPDVLYYGTSEGMNYYIKNSGMSYQLSRIESWKEEEDSRLAMTDINDATRRKVPDQIGTYRVDAEWLNANSDFEVVQGHALDGYNNYYNVPEGVEPALFVKKYETLTLKNVWEGIDLHYYGTNGFLETDYLVSPGADYRKIRIQFKGAELSTDYNGNLIIKTPFGEIHEGALKVYQNNERIEASWKISEDNVVSFEIPNYNSDLALRIDPLTRVWGTYYGGSELEENRGIDVDLNGNVFIIGETSSLTQIATTGSHQTTHGTGANMRDAFIVKFNNSGVVQWGTYYGGNSDEQCFDVARDVNGDIYLVGSINNTVTSSSAIATVGAHQTIFGGAQDGFIAKFNSNGVRLWGTYYGGIGGETLQGIDIDNNGNVYVTGNTSGPSSSISIATPGTFQPVYSGAGADAIVVKFNSSGVRLWGTCFGGNGNDWGRKIVTDNNGDIYVLGDTKSTDVIASNGAHQSTYSGGTQEDAFLVKFNDLGQRLWSTYYGGVGYENPRDLIADAQGNIFFSGYSNSSSSITTVGAHQSTIGGGIDAFLVKFNTSGIRQWGTYYGGLDGDYGSGGLAIDTDGNIYMSGYTNSTASISTLDAYQPNYGGSSDAFITKFSNSGIRVWGTYYGGSGLESFSGGLVIDNYNRLYLSGYTNSSSNISTSNSYQTTNNGGYDAFLVKFKQTKINGKTWQDLNSNCILDISETGIVNGVSLTIQPGNFITQSINGIWSLDSLPTGTYIVTIDTTNLNWTPTCPITQSFTVTNPNGFTDGPNFGLISTNPCSDPDVSIFAPFLRPCIPNQMIYVSACNQTTATGALNASYVDVELDPLMAVTASSLPFTNQGNNIYRFQTGTLNPGQCVNFSISTTISSPILSCTELLGLTLCMDANLYPVQSCALDTVPSDPPTGGGGSAGGILDGLPQPCTLPWDQSSLSVDGWCQNDTIYFTITNTGELGGGNMECYSPVWVTVDGVVTFTDSIMIQGGQTVTYSFPGDGATWILNAEQHPLHPGNSHPNAHVEACGEISNWTPDLVNDFPQDDADPVVDIYCGVVTGSYDPNDKTGYPVGVTDQYYIQPNQQLQYVIRFQNTGTDTAFTVVIRDTLDTDLNIFTVTSGVSSHPYTFKMYGPRVLEWTFNNINLPDSSSNQAGSNGFVTFHVEQVPNLGPGTQITNDADIYFDFNDPITTNTTMHRIYEGFVSVAALEEMSKEKARIFVYPNPNNGEFTIVLGDNSVGNYSIFDQQGRVVKTGSLDGEKTTIDMEVQNGMYYLMVGDGVVKMQVMKK
jgi:uncharacterized repeat protein (TIGR01451 family)